MVRRSQTAAWIMLVAALAAGVYFLSAFLAVGALATLTVILFNPFYRALRRLLRGRVKTAAGLTLVSALIVTIIPLIVVAILSYFQALTVFADLQHAHVTPGRIMETVRHSVDGLNRLTAKLPDGQGLHLSADGVVQSLQSLVPTTGNAILAFLSQTSGGLIDFFTGFILYLVLVFYLLVHQDIILAWLKRISPFAPAINDRYLRHLSAVGRSMVLGTFVVSAVQGVIGAVVLAIAGVPYPVFWAVLLTLLSFLPLGSGLLIIPIGIAQLMLGNIWQGLFILAMHLVVITNIDNFLRALLVSKDAQLPPILTLFSAFAGIKFFGALGVIYGPIIMGAIFTTIQIYNEAGEGGIPLKTTRATEAA